MPTPLSASIPATAPPPPPVSTLLGDLAPPGPVINWEAVDYGFGSPATGGLFRLHGIGWSWFCKVLQHVRHWPALSMMPPAIAGDFETMYPWRSELEMWDEPWLATLPPGMRVPELHGVIELGDDRVAVWMENVVESPKGWDLDRFVHVAHLLGRWNARTSAPGLVALNPYIPGYALRKYAENSVVFRGLRPLADDVLWSHPWLVPHQELRTDLHRLGQQIPFMLDRLDTFTQAIPHGDASPQNLLVPAEDPDVFVVIDVSFRSPHALGFDLGQLLIGLVHAGQMRAAKLPEIASAILPAYLDGLSVEGIKDVSDEVHDAFTWSAMLRSGFDGFRLDLLASETEHDRDLFDERIVLSKFLVKQCTQRSRPGRAS